MTANVACVAASVLMLTGCVVREVHEIRYVREGDARAPGASSSSGGTACTTCDGGDAPGAVMAETQPPPLLVEEALDQPAPGQVWVDGYWHWNGFEWVWMAGNWVAPVDDQVFVPPAYYASGSHCLYVPGRWERAERVPRIVRYRRPRATSVRDHRGEVPGKKPTQRPSRDHRGEQPVDVDRSFRGSRDVVISVPPSRRRHVPAPPTPASGASDVIGAEPDTAAEPGRERREFVIPSAPVQPTTPVAPPISAPIDRPVGGVVVRPGRIAPPSARAPSGWARPVSPGNRADGSGHRANPPVRLAPTEPAAGRWSTPARVAAPPPQTAPPSNRAPNQASTPATNASQSSSRARPAARSGPVRTIRVPRR